MKRLFMAAVLLPLLLAGCKSLSLSGEYVKSDRATYNAIAPGYAKYVVGDGELDEDQKARRLLLLDSWESRLSKAEADTASAGKGD